MFRSASAVVEVVEPLGEIIANELGQFTLLKVSNLKVGLPFSSRAVLMMYVSFYLDRRCRRCCH